MRLKQDLRDALPIAQSFARLLHPFAEVVIHDLQNDRIAAIYNPISRREVGDPSYLERWDFTAQPDEDIIGPYEKTNFDGRILKSISLVLRNRRGHAVGFLCVNMDVSVFESTRNTLDIFLNNHDRTLTQSKQKLFKDDVYEQINLFIQAYCQDNHLSLAGLSRDDKKAVILQLHQEGAFDARNATAYIARILNISRATVYNHLNKRNQT